MALEQELILKFTTNADAIDKVNKKYDTLMAGVRKAELEFKKHNLTAAEAVKVTDALGREIAQLEVEEKKLVAAEQAIWHANNRMQMGFRSLASETKTANAHLQNMRGQIGMLGTNISRIAQDAPFGLMAIQNNIEPLLQSFTQLKVVAQQTNISMSSLVTQSLMGPAGLIAAVSAAIPLVSTFTAWFDKLGERADAAAVRIRNAYKLAASYKGSPGEVSDLFADMKTKEAALRRAESSGMPLWAYLPNMLGAGIQSQRADLLEAQAAYKESFYAWQNAGLGLVGHPKDTSSAQLTRDIRNLPGEKSEDDPYKSISGKFVGPTFTPYKHDFVGSTYAPGRSQRLGGATAWADISGGGAPKVMNDVASKWQGLALHMGSQLSSALANGFQRGFAAGENILKSFTDAVLSSLLGIAAQQTTSAGVAGILSLAFPALGGFGKIFGALGGLFGGDTVRPGITTGGGGSVGGQLESINKSINSLNLRVDNVGLSLAVRRGDSTMSDRVG